MLRLALPAVFTSTILAFLQVRSDDRDLAAELVDTKGQCLSVTYVGPSRDKNSDAWVNALVFAAWPDGRLVWSHDREQGGAPFSQGRVEPRSIDAVLRQFESDGVFANGHIQLQYGAPDLPFTSISVKSGTHEVRLDGYHDLVELLGNESRLDNLRKKSGDYLAFRLEWSDAELRFERLIAAALSH